MSLMKHASETNISARTSALQKSASATASVTATTCPAVNNASPPMPRWSSAATNVSPTSCRARGPATGTSSCAASTATRRRSSSSTTCVNVETSAWTRPRFARASVWMAGCRAGCPAFEKKRRICFISVAIFASRTNFPARVNVCLVAPSARATARYPSRVTAAQRRWTKS
uniref:Uncharacterized protein n=1 Tax=Pseudodiaptomus poplesia TaxID=213370 RepID=A0A0U2M9V8_9MAXI|nr:hypothetical protein [Pseudodiaptomus poplesia]